jgi:uncharacterized cupredoxin-like copper-binding protein
MVVGLLTALLGFGAYSATGAPERQTATALTRVTVTAGRPSEFKFTFSRKSVNGGIVVFLVRNRGEVSHDFKIAGKKTRNLAPGASQTLRVRLTKGKKPYLCTVAGHAAAGMKGTLTVR